MKGDEALQMGIIIRFRENSDIKIIQAYSKIIGFDFEAIN